MSTLGDYAGNENHSGSGASKIVCLHPKGIVDVLSIVVSTSRPALIFRTQKGVFLASRRSIATQKLKLVR